jgi:hypothetical protein
MKKYLILFIFLFFVKFVFPQTFHIGAMTGYARGWSNTDKEKLGVWNVNSISFIVDFKPDKPILDFSSGLAFQTLYSDGWTSNFLKLPLGMDFIIGNKYKIFFGGGIYGQLRLFDTPNFYDDDYKHFQFGAFADLGFQFRLNDKYSLFFKFQYDKDLTPIFRHSHRSPGGSLDYVDEFLSDLSINIGFKFKLKSK